VLDVLGGARKPITILFSDLRDFTALTESANETVLVAQLNEYFNQMVRTVFANGGTLDKFIGDAVMAHWGSVKSAGVEKDAYAAIRAALQMRETLARRNASGQTRAVPELGCRSGIDTGYAVDGNL